MNFLHLCFITFVSNEIYEKVFNKNEITYFELKVDIKAVVFTNEISALLSVTT